MAFWTTYASIVLGIIGTAQASSGAAHGSIKDLLWPVVNVVILFAVLIWKTKAPIKAFFDKKAEDVSNTVERANLKSKEAQLMLENQQRKMTGLQNEIKNLNQYSETEVVNFDKKLAKEIQEKESKLKADAAAKIQADKKAMIDELNAELLDQVINKAKSTIKTNKEYQNKVSSKLLQRLQ